MGGRMAARVQEAGDPIVAYDRDAERLAASGIEAAGSVGELVAAVDVVLLSLPDSGVIEPVMLGAGGVLEHARPDQVVVDLSTASPHRPSGSTPPWRRETLSFSTPASRVGRRPPMPAR